LSAFKIAYIFTPIEFGGAERVNLNFLKNVDRSRFLIYPILLIRPWEEDNFFVQELKKIDYPIYKVPVAIRPRSEGKDCFRGIRCYKMIHSILKENSFDLVHTHGYFADIVGVPAAKRVGIPNISTCHGYIPKNKSVILYNMLDHLVLRFSNRIIAVSEGIKRELIKSGISGSKIEVILNAVQTKSDNTTLIQNKQKRRQALGIKEDDFVVGYVGRLSEEKGVVFLIEAISMLNLDIPVRLLIIGDGPQKKELEDLVEIKGIKDKTLFAGFQDDVEDWLTAMDIFALPSLTEGTPMALLEAMACGIPVIASAVGGVPAVITNKENGILVEPGNSSDLAKGLHLLFQEPSFRAIISERGKNHIKQNYDVHNWCREIEEQYNLLVEKTNG
jgi:glycosyltransferase involved in cell wall biosynthesis